MTTHNTLFTLLAVTALTSSFALTPSLARAEDTPKPIADLEKFVGTWKGAGTLTMGKDTAKVAATITCKRTSGGAAVGCTGRFTGIPGVPAIEETDLFGYDAGTNSYHWYAVTNAGETHDHVAKASSEPKLQFVHTGTQEGKPFKEVIDVEFAKDGKSMTVRSDSSVAGQSVAVLDLKARK